MGIQMQKEHSVSFGKAKVAEEKVFGVSSRICIIKMFSFVLRYDNEMQTTK